MIQIRSSWPSRRVVDEKGGRLDFGKVQNTEQDQCVAVVQEVESNKTGSMIQSESHFYSTQRLVETNNILYHQTAPGQHKNINKWSQEDRQQIGIVGGEKCIQSAMTSSKQSSHYHNHRAQMGGIQNESQLRQQFEEDIDSSQANMTWKSFKKTTTGFSHKLVDRSRKQTINSLIGQNQQNMYAYARKTPLKRQFQESMKILKKKQSENCVLSVVGDQVSLNNNNTSQKKTNLFKRQSADSINSSSIRQISPQNLNNTQQPSKVNLPQTGTTANLNSSVGNQVDLLSVDEGSQKGIACSHSKDSLERVLVGEQEPVVMFMEEETDSNKVSQFFNSTDHYTRIVVPSPNFDQKAAVKIKDQDVYFNTQGLQTKEDDQSRRSLTPKSIENFQVKVYSDKEEREQISAENKKSQADKQAKNESRKIISVQATNKQSIKVGEKRFVSQNDMIKNNNALKSSKTNQISVNIDGINNQTAMHQKPMKRGQNLDSFENQSSIMKTLNMNRLIFEKTLKRKGPKNVKARILALQSTNSVDRSSIQDHNMSVTSQSRYKEDKNSAKKQFSVFNLMRQSENQRHLMQSVQVQFQRKPKKQNRKLSQEDKVDSVEDYGISVNNNSANNSSQNLIEGKSCSQTASSQFFGKRNQGTKGGSKNNQQLLSNLESKRQSYRGIQTGNESIRTSKRLLENHQQLKRTLQEQSQMAKTNQDLFAVNQMDNFLNSKTEITPKFVVNVQQNDLENNCNQINTLTLPDAKEKQQFQDKRPNFLSTDQLKISHNKSLHQEKVKRQILGQMIYYKSQKAALTHLNSSNQSCETPIPPFDNQVHILSKDFRCKHNLLKISSLRSSLDSQSFINDAAGHNSEMSLVSGEMKNVPLFTPQPDFFNSQNYLLLNQPNDINQRASLDNLQFHQQMSQSTNLHQQAHYFAMKPKQFRPLIDNAIKQNYKNVLYNANNSNMDRVSTSQPISPKKIVFQRQKGRGQPTNGTNTSVVLGTENVDRKSNKRKKSGNEMFRMSKQTRKKNQISPDNSIF